MQTTTTVPEAGQEGPQTRTMVPEAAQEVALTHQEGEADAVLTSRTLPRVEQKMGFLRRVTLAAVC